MKVALEKKTLVDMVLTVARAAARNTVIPILGGLHMETKDGKLWFSATDMELGIRASTTEVEISEPGSVLVTAEHLASLAPKLINGVITIETKDKLEVKHGRNKAKINLLEGDWPGLPSEERVHRFTLPQDAIKTGLSQVAFAAASKHFRQVFNGILVDIADGVISFVASDTHRLAVCEYPIEAENWQVVAPARTVVELLRILKPEDGGTITVSTVGNNLFFSWGDFEVSSATISGDYPDYRSVIPSRESAVVLVKVDTGDMQSCINRLRVLPPDSKQGLLHTLLKIGSENIVIQASSDSVGTVNEICSAESSGENLEIALNQKFLSDALSVMDQETKILFTGPETPAIVQSRDNHQVILVPLRTHA